MSSTIASRAQAVTRASTEVDRRKTVGGDLTFQVSCGGCVVDVVNGTITAIDGEPVQPARQR